MNELFNYKYLATTETSMDFSSNLLLKQIDKVANPSFSFRNRIADMDMLDGDQAASLGYSNSYEWEMSSSPHAMCDRYLNYGNFKDSHPTWFQEGQDKWGQTQYQLCYSAHGSHSDYEAMVNETCLEIQNEINEAGNSWVFDNSNNPQFTIDLSMQDNWYQCDCETCQRECSSSGTYGSYSGQQLHFVNDVANAMDAWLTNNKPRLHCTYKMLAYQQGQKAPSNIAYSLNENIEIQFAPVKIDMSKPLAPTGANAEHYQDLKSWVDLFNSKDNVSVDNISVWYYSYSTNSIVPINDYDAFQETYKNIHSLGIRKISNQFITNGTQLTSFQDLSLYLKAKVMENVNVDLDLATREFMDGYYGAGSSKIYEYFQLMKSNMASTYTENTMFDTHDSKTYWSKTVVNDLIRLCDEAITNIENNETNEERKALLIDRVNREKCTAIYMSIQYNYVSILNKRSYKELFRSTCAKFNITMIDTSTSVADWLNAH